MHTQFAKIYVFKPYSHEREVLALLCICVGQGLNGGAVKFKWHFLLLIS